MKQTEESPRPQTSENFRRGCLGVEVAQEGLELQNLIAPHHRLVKENMTTEENQIFAG